MANYKPMTWSKDRINDALWGEGAEHNALFKALSSYMGSDEFPPTYINHDYFFLGLEITEYDARIDSYDGEEYFVRIACYFLNCINKHVADDYGEGHEHQWLNRNTDK